jgi:hypothetical protein
MVVQGALFYIFHSHNTEYVIWTRNESQYLGNVISAMIVVPLALVTR